MKAQSPTKAILNLLNGVKHDWKFHVEIRKSDSIKYPQLFYGVLVGRNNEETYVCEMCMRKQSIIKTAKNWFPGVTIVDKTK